MISANHPFPAKALITHRPCTTSADRNGWSPLDISAYTPWWLEVNFIGMFIFHHRLLFSLHPLSLPVPVSTSLIPVYLTLGHVIFLFWTIIHLWPSSIKATLFLYYTSALISTKIINHLLPLRSPLLWPRGLTKLKDRDCPWVQHISWSLVLLPGRNHGMFTSPSEALATSWILYQIPVWISS